ncbi:hypothetical protein HMPREF9334_00343 [Selenomonas infelix ATCC 43532]|uniref:Uncharacterized protein n=1 Tax=Selenomonas infelix ATCC 43532 TaxID=679201 RepID=G5GM62_9FIRM|nr:hypothetical protein [Selenomonas infelix]EHG22307.1 hypothetical protein HMPREF9334_00343 [Selenomonas infelix ATCC 43532]
MEANTTTASPVIPAASQISQGRTTESVQNRGDQGDSSAAFSQRTNVSIETAIDHMADVLSKINGRQQTNVQQMPQELKEVIQNMIRQSFSLETTLGQGLGSTAASQRFSTDQLTTLSRMLNQLGTMSEEGSAPQVSDDLASLLTGLKTALSKEAGGTFEPIMLTKAAFQLLDTGNAELLPKDLQTFLAQLNAQGSASASGNAGANSLTFLNQLVQLLMPRGTENTAQQMPQPTAVQEGMAQPTAQNSAGGQEGRTSSSTPNTSSAVPEETTPEQQMLRTQTPVSTTNAGAKESTTATQRQPAGMPLENTGKAPQPPAQTNSSTPQSTPPAANEVGIAQKAAAGEAPQGINAPERVQTPAPSTGNTQNAAQNAKETTMPLPRQGESQTPVENRPAPDTGTKTPTNTEAQTQAAKSNPQGETAAQSVRPQGGQAAELPTAPNTPAHSAAQMKTPEMQSTIPRFFTQTMENTPQTMNVLRNLAQTLLQNENLSQKEALLLQNFVSGRGQTLSEGDAKQLQQLIQLTQQNIPGTVRQAAFEQQMPDLPRLWAFMQMADIVKTRKMTAEQYKRAGRDVAALALTMRNALEGENAAPQPGQRSMNFVMPLFMGASEYPAYIHVYDETKKDEETDLIKKETWLRICVLTDNIGTVELINRIYEENHVDMRLYFSDADAAWEFRHVLDEIRESADGTSLVIEGIQIGAIGERRFFTN